MKKYISFIALLALCVSMFAACAPAKPAEPTDSTPTPSSSVPAEDNLAAAKEYLTAMYRKAPTTTNKDYEVVSAVVIGTDTFQITWSANHDSIQFVKGDNNMVTVDLNEKNPEEVKYILTATLADASGKTETVTFAERRVPACISITDKTTEKELLELAYKLEGNMTIPTAMTGKISAAKDYSEKYKNREITIVVDGVADKPIVCFRLVGEGIDKLAVGDTVTVAGVLKNYKGTIEFDQGCTIIPDDQMMNARLALAGYLLEDGVAQDAPITLTGVVTEAKDYNEKYKNRDLTMVVAGLDKFPIVCFRLKGDAVKDVAVGNTITVTGTLKNYKGTIEFDQGCTLDAVK